MHSWAASRSSSPPFGKRVRETDCRLRSPAGPPSDRTWPQFRRSGSASLLPVRCTTLRDRARNAQTSTFNADQRTQARNTPRKAGMLGCGHYRPHVLVSTGRFLRDTARRRAADDNTLRGQLVDEGAPAPSLERGVPGQCAACAVACRGERLLLTCCRTDQNVGARPHAAADKDRLSYRKQGFGQARMPRSESPRRTLAMDKQLPLLAVNGVQLDLTGVVGDVVEKLQIAGRKEVM